MIKSIHHWLMAGVHFALRITNTHHMGVGKTTAWVPWDSSTRPMAIAEQRVLCAGKRAMSWGTERTPPCPAMGRWPGPLCVPHQVCHIASCLAPPSPRQGVPAYLLSWRRGSGPARHCLGIITRLGDEKRGRETKGGQLSCSLRVHQ